MNDSKSDNRIERSFHEKFFSQEYNGQQFPGTNNGIHFVSGDPIHCCQ